MYLNLRKKKYLFKQTMVKFIDIVDLIHHNLNIRFIIQTIMYDDM